QGHSTLIIACVRAETQRFPRNHACFAKCLGSRVNASFRSHGIDGEQCIHRAGAETFEVERDELEPNCFELLRQSLEDFEFEYRRKLFARNFDANDFAVMTNAILPKPKFAEKFFAALNLLERFSCHG